MSRQWNPRGSVQQNAAHQLPQIALAYFEAGAALVAGAPTPEDMHPFRLKTKHFRYTMELFQEHYEAPFAGLMKRLKPVQDALGEINDGVTALAWLKKKESPEAREYLKQRIADKSTRFETYWRTVFDKPGERERWKAVLGKPLSTPRGTAGGRAEG